MKTLTMFNHKGGVGKTTLSINLANAMIERGYCVLLVDADPQCNLTSFYLSEKQLDELLSESNDENGGTIWSAIKPVVQGTGPYKCIDLFLVDGEDSAGLWLCPGDVFLSLYEEELPAAWNDSFTRKTRGYDVTCALSRVTRDLGKKYKADIIIYDVGPNVGPLNRAVILGSDFFITPVAADLFSLRALSTVGRSIARWLTDWKTVRELASLEDRRNILRGRPKYIGYVTSSYKVSSGRLSTKPHKYWESKIAPRVRDKIIEDIRAVNPALVPDNGNKIAEVKNFHSLAPRAQEYGIAIAKLKGHVHAGNNPQISEAEQQFDALAKEVLARMGLF